MLGKQSREFHCSRLFGNPGKTLALVYEICCINVLLLKFDLRSRIKSRDPFLPLFDFFGERIRNIYTNLL